MGRILLFGTILSMIVMASNTGGADSPVVIINEEFSSLEDWEPVIFPKIKAHSKYEILTTETGGILVASSKASASGIRYTKEFDAYAYPVATWRWKIDNVYTQGDVEQKSGDDYPLRVYIMFKYDPEQASLGEMLKYGLAKAWYGEYPPHSSLNYIWANRKHDRTIYTSLYTDRAKLIILRSGKSETGKWLQEEVNILDDYKRAFGRLPPAKASIAIMNDSDNTGESSTSYLDYIRVMRKE